MITAVVGAGGKTSLIRELAARYRAAGKTVLVTTTTRMYIEPDSLLTDDPAVILTELARTGYAMAGTPAGEGKLTALSEATLRAVCAAADEILIEADGAKHLPLKFPRPGEPVIPPDTGRIIVVCGLHALGLPAREAVFRLEQAEPCLAIDGGTIIAPAHIQALVRKGYEEPMKERFPESELIIHAAHDGSLYQRALAALLAADLDTALLREEWFSPRPCLFLCGGGHVSLELAELAHRLDFRIKVMDPRPEFANPERFPFAEEIICAPFSELREHTEPGAYYAVVTSGHRDDEACVRTILGTPHRYLGMIGSRRKVARTFESLAADGVPRERIETIHAPIGLPIGAVTPAEIAVSILAEIIREKNLVSAASVSAELLNGNHHGMLCVIIEKQGSTPRGTGSMMLVNEHEVIDTIGGGRIEYAVIRDARAHPEAAIRDYVLTESEGGSLGMACGGRNRVLFLPV